MTETAHHAPTGTDTRGEAGEAEHEGAIAEHAKQLPLFPFDVPQDEDFVERYAEYRAGCPVPKVRMATGGEAYIVTRYKDARRVFADPVFSRAACMDPAVPLLLEGIRLPEILSNIDGPEHLRQRGLTVRAFTTGSAERFRPKVQRIADDLIDAMSQAGPPADFIAGFGNPYPNLVILRIFGVPDEDFGQLLQWLTRILSYRRHTPAQQAEAYRACNRYFAELVARKRADPDDDLTSALVQANDADEKFSEEQLASLILVNVSGGTTAAANILPNSLLTFARHPDQWELLRERPELIPNAVAEVLRYVSVGNTSFERLTMQDVEVSGVHIPAGSVVIPLLASANMDAEAWDEPERFDVTRPVGQNAATGQNGSQHLGYGHGPHRCIGSPLANVELEVAYSTLLQRMPNLRLAVPESELQWEPRIAMRRMIATPVVW